MFKYKYLPFIILLKAQKKSHLQYWPEFYLYKYVATTDTDVRNWI